MIDVACICQDEQETIDWTLRACESIVPHLGTVVIVDGGSVDGTLDIIESWRGRLPIMLLRQPFDNFCSQKNRALERCASEWIVLADADMTWGSNLAWELNRASVNHLDRNTCIDVPLFSTVLDAHHYRSDLGIGGSTRIVRNVGCRYVRSVHEYLVWPGEEDPRDRLALGRSDWSSIRELPRLRAYGQVPFFEHTWRRSDEALRNKVRRYRRFAHQSSLMGLYMDCDDEDYLVREKERILRNELYDRLPPGRDRYVVEGT